MLHQLELFGVSEFKEFSVLFSSFGTENNIKLRYQKVRYNFYILVYLLNQNKVKHYHRYSWDKVFLYCNTLKWLLLRDNVAQRALVEHIEIRLIFTIKIREKYHLKCIFPINYDNIWINIKYSSTVIPILEMSVYIYKKVVCRYG